MIPKFGELITSKTLAGDKKLLADVLDKEIVVTGYRISNSKYSKTDSCVTIQFYYADDTTETKYILFTGSGVIRNQLEEVVAKLEESGNEVLFSTTISKIGKYHAMC